MITKVLFIISIILIDNCIDYHIENIHEINNSIPLEGWEIEFVSVRSDATNYLLFNTINDTVYNLSFDLQEDSLNKVLNNYNILSFKKKYDDISYVYNLQMNEDTLFFYRQNKHEPDLKEFYVGKYYYMFSNPNEFDFRDCEMLYFMENMDSLIKVRGNNLPDLPCGDH